MEAEIVIPEGVGVVFQDNNLQVTGKEGAISKKFKSNFILIEIKDGKVLLKALKDKKRSFAELNTFKKIINNMLSGVLNKYKYELKMVYSHFPMTVKVQGNKFFINNFVGEKNIREVNIPEIVKVEAKGKDITVISVDKELAGTVAGNIEKATKVKGKDTRVYQDGIYIIKKGVQDE
jgi:large subunit ribosomal protein L6